MMKYKIMIDYTTGDSFGSERRTSDIGEWKDLGIVEENLKRIKTHYQWYYERHDTWRDSPKNPTKQEDYMVDDYSLKLKLDDGTEYQTYTFWTGYFETLHGAYVDMNMGFTI